MLGTRCCSRGSSGSRSSRSSTAYTAAPRAVLAALEYNCCLPSRSGPARSPSPQGYRPATLMLCRLSAARSMRRGADVLVSAACSRAASLQSSRRTPPLCVHSHGQDRRHSMSTEPSKRPQQVHADPQAVHPPQAVHNCRQYTLTWQNLAAAGRSAQGLPQRRQSCAAGRSRAEVSPSLLACAGGWGDQGLAVPSRWEGEPALQAVRLHCSRHRRRSFPTMCIPGGFCVHMPMTLSHFTPHHANCPEESTPSARSPVRRGGQRNLWRLACHKV